MWGRSMKVRRHDGDAADVDDVVDADVDEVVAEAADDADGRGSDDERPAINLQSGQHGMSRRRKSGHHG